MRKSNEESMAEIIEHGAAGIEFYKDGQEIHHAYLVNPDEYSLIDEIDKFVDHLERGAAEIQKAIELSFKSNVICWRH